MSRSYTAEERAAYWKKQALGKSKSSASGSSKPTYNKSPSYKASNKKVGKTGIVSGKTVSRTIGTGLGTAAGLALGGPAGGAVGGAIGNFLGGKIGHLVDSITGFGDYKVMSNSIMKGGLSPPSVMNTTNRGGVIVRHREYIGDVLATTNFTTQTFKINPGLLNSQQGAFPWLAQFANSYEQYRFRGLLFEYQSTSSDALLSSATSTALGTVNMATQYDVSQPVFTDKRAMLNYEFANSRKPSCSFIHPVECKLSQTPVKLFYTRSGAIPSGADPGRFDFCQFTIATEGMQAAGGVLGELWVTYEIEFFKQQFEQAAFTDHFQLTGITNIAPFGNVTGQQAKNIAQGGTIGGLLTGPGTTYAFPSLLGSGTYFVVFNVVGGSVTTAAYSISYTNCVALQLFESNTATIVDNGATNSNTFLQMFMIRVTKQGASFSFGGGTLPASATAGDLWVTQVSPNLT